MFPDQLHALTQHIKCKLATIKQIDLYDHQYDENNPSKELRTVPAVFFEFDVENSIRKKDGTALKTVTITMHLVSTGLLEAGKKTSRHEPFSHQDLYDGLLQAFDRFGANKEERKIVGSQTKVENYPIIRSMTLVDEKPVRKIGRNAVTLVMYRALFFTYQNRRGYRGLPTENVDICYD